ncbi:hypothetical protein ACIBI9_14275 [Nonomuraea sp. NPDC050451]|uniref:hypothetical protein n=1 Tax=Nonomuraea sp. NPDC050451 TaxID=3364364 RepID=UPI0037BB4DAA
MSTDLEDDLSRVLGRAAEGAPQAPTGFPGRIAARSRRRRTRTQALVAAIAMVIVGVTVRGTVGAQVAQTKLPEPVETVWPDAVWKIPRQLPGLPDFHPAIFIDSRTLLLETSKSDERADAVYAYDLGSGRTRKIADIPSAKWEYAFAYTVGEGRIVWQTIDKNDHTRFWSVPVSGGKPAAIDTGGPVKGRGEELTVVGDRVAFSLVEGGVFTFPLRGGRVTPVAGAERHHILRWPWVGTPSDDTQDREPSFRELLNAETGQASRAVVRPGESYVRCGVTTCVGLRPDGTRFYRLRDGSRERDLPGSPVLGLGDDRFMAVDPPGPAAGQALLDLATGKQGDLGLRPSAEGRMSGVEPGILHGGLVSYQLKDQYVIIDLARIR